jgi:hypothetical protein
MLALPFIAFGALCSFYPNLLLRLYARTTIGFRYPLGHSNEKVLYCRAYGLVFLSFGAFLAWPT